MTELLSPELVEKLAEIAQKEARSIEELVRDMVTQYKTTLDVDESIYEEVRTIIKAGDFDQLRLVSQNHDIREIMQKLLDRNEISMEDFPPNSSLRLAISALRMPAFGEPSNMAEDAREILRTKYVDYLLARQNREAIDEKDID